MITVWPRLTCPSPATTTLPPLRTVRMVVPCQVAGLMSLGTFEEVHDRLVELREAAWSLGVTLEEPFLQLAFLALPVIPALKITDRGMVDVTRFEIIA